MRATPVLLFALLACGGDGSSDGADAATADAAGSEDGLPGTCTGTCQELTVAVQFGDASGGFVRAYYGVTAADGTLHIEAHAGGTPGCPPEGNATERTLVVGSVPAPSSAEPLDQDDGVSVGFLDFRGDILTGRPVESATAEQLTPVAASPEAAGGFIAFDLSATFEGGSASGRVYATHCESMDQ